ncbi:MAG TPA: hypothetical protein VD969_06995 [Symbiobacteriaceae bacterium]|nr:hypothetical protein [Symbiobacteriaceae bacterium]
MKPRQEPGSDVKDALRAAYEAGKAAARHFDAPTETDRAKESEADREDWHH